MLTFAEGIRRTAIAQGVNEAALAALRQHADDSQVAERACKLLFNLSLDGAARLVV